MKKLSKEGIFECGLLNIAPRKVKALTVVTGKECLCLGLAVANEPGYYPVPQHWCYGDNFEELATHADELNKELFDLEPKATALIVASSMAAGKTRRGKLRSAA